MIIVGTAPRVALTVARSLARRGIRVVTVPSSDDERRIPSNAVAQHVPLPDALSQPADFDAGLEGAVRRTGADLLIPCSDKALAAIARNYAALHACADPGCPAPPIVARVLDKSATIAAARELGMAVPAVYDLAGGLPGAQPGSQPLAYPLIAKPKNHAGLGGVRIRYFRDPGDLENAMGQDPDFAARYLLQQFVPGTGTGVGVLMRGGDACAVFVHRRLKELPAAGGVSVVSESAAPDAALVDKALALLRALQWDGVAQVEFRRAPDGTDWLMEINGRYWGSISTAVAAGVDFPYYHWQSAHGERPDAARSYPQGVRVRWTRGAVLRLRERLFERPGFGTTRQGAAQELRSFWRDFTPAVRSALWQPSDPVPAIVDVMPALSRFASSAVRSAVKAILPSGLRQAYRRLGAAGAWQYLWRGRATLPRPFVPRSVLFVCSGNIMRSALAAAIVEKTLRDLGVRDIAVDSSGLHAAAGTPADPRTLLAAEPADIDLRSHRAKPMTEALANANQAIFAMDGLQVIELRRRFPVTARKTYALGACLPGRAPLDIPDPYLADEGKCRAIFALVAERATELARLLAEDVSCRLSLRGETDETRATGPGAT